MSRNLQRKQNPRVGQKCTKKKAPTNKDITSPDDDYAGVDLISDEDEPDVEKAEADALIKEYMEEGSDADSQFEDVHVGGNDEIFAEFIDYQHTESFPDQLDALQNDARLHNVSKRPSSASSKSSSSDSSTDNDVDSDLPIFYSFDSLPPYFQTAIELEASDHDSWDLASESGRADDSETVGGASSGYESDVNEETDEEPEDPARNFINISESGLKLLETTDSDDELEGGPRKRRKMPALGTYINDAAIPYAFANKEGKVVGLQYNDFVSMPRIGELDLMGGPFIPEEHHLQMGFPNNVTDSSSNGDDCDEGLDAFEDSMDLNAFIEYGESSEDEQTPSKEPCHTEIKGPLDHLVDVFAFRRNQDQHQQLARNAVTADSLAFAGATTVRGMKKDKLAAANAPMTPSRIPKAQKAIRENAAASSPASPMPDAAKRNRRFSVEQKHKRKRSKLEGERRDQERHT